MANIQRLRVEWTGFPGAPGVSTFYALDAVALMSPLHYMFSTHKDIFPSDVTITALLTGDIIDPLNGDLVGSWSGGSWAPITGTDTGPYTAPAGAVINWQTGDVLDGHRLRGKTFLVPLGGGAYDLTGSIAATTLGYIQTVATYAANTALGNFVVWHRPRAARAADGSRPAVTYRAGGYSQVTAATVPDKSVVLRSRRD